MRIAVLALTPVERDARVLRSASALSKAGHQVTVIGRQPVPNATEFSCVALPAVPSPAVQRLELVATQAAATLWPASAHPLYWLPAVRRQLLQRALEARPDVVLSNDWLALPVGRAVKARLGSTLVYDSHEYAAKEHVNNWKWRLVSRAAVSALERRNVASADLVLTVSQGIAEALQADHGLAITPTVIRNLPRYRKVRCGAPNLRRKVLFHGLIRPERGLEALIDSVPLWTFGGDVVVRGYGLESYVDSLRSRAQARGLSCRVSFEPPVSPDELIERAAFADIGYLVLPAGSEHYEYALPNKLFEYLMAGLPVLAAPRREIRATLMQTGAGLFSEPEPVSLAAALNAVSPDALAAMRRGALSAAERLNWDVEEGRLVEAVESAHRDRGDAGQSRP